MKPLAPDGEKKRHKIGGGACWADFGDVGV